MNNEKLELIIDGANLLHDDRGIEIYDEEGETVMQNRPERLAKGIQIIVSNKGWKTTAILKRGNLCLFSIKSGIRVYWRYQHN